MHDTVNIETAGVPMAFVASTEFADAARTQSEALGAEPARVFVKHPIQDRTDDELRALADEAFEALVAAVTTGG